MKTLLASIIIGSLSLSPAFAQVDNNQYRERDTKTQKESGVTGYDTDKQQLQSEQDSDGRQQWQRGQGADGQLRDGPQFQGDQDSDGQQQWQRDQDSDGRQQWQRGQGTDGQLRDGPQIGDSVMTMSDQDRQLNETDQNRRSGQDGLSRDVDKKQNETEQNRGPGQDGLSRDMDKKQNETEQKRSEQTGEYQAVPKSDQDQQKKTDQDRQGITGEDRRTGQTGESQVLPKYDQDREVTTDPARPHRATDVEPQEGYQRVSSDLITADDLQSASVYGSNNESMANVNEVLMTPEGKVEQIVVNVGGFLGMGGRSVAIDVDEADIHKGANDDLRVYIPMSEEELRKMPEYKK